MKKKHLTAVIAIVAVAILAAGATLAWLTAQTDSVTNTFTVGNVDITLAESDNLDLKMVPGHTITKDPKVTVVAGSEKSYIFVKVEKSTNFDDFMEYTIDSDEWTALDGVTGVYYRIADASTTNQTFSVLASDRVTVKDTVTKAMMDGLTASTYPKLTFTAYAVQYNSTNNAHFEAIDAWNQVKDL